MKVRRLKSIWQVGVAGILVASLVIVAAAAAPAAADGTPVLTEGFWKLTVGGDATSEWSTDQAYSGCYSAHLKTTGTVGDGDEARVVVPLPAGTTLGDIDSISWWEYLAAPAGYPPHVDVSLDFDDDGVRDDILVFEYAYNSETHAAEGQPTYGALADAWYQTFSDDGNGPAVIDDTANAWLGSGPPGPLGDPNFIYGTLGQWKAGTVTGGEQVDTNTTVLFLEIEADNWITQTEAYVDQVAINGVLYPVEPVLLEIEPSIALDVKSSIQCFEVATNFYPLDATIDYDWSIEPGVNLSAGDIAITDGGDGYPYICIRSMDPGDAHVFCKLLCGDELHAEKKWGVIEETKLDLDPSTATIETHIEARAGTSSNPDLENFRDTIYAWFYWGEEEIEVHTAGHAVVHWWLFDKDKLETAELLDDLEALVGCGTYDPPPADSPFEEIQAIYSAGMEADVTYINLADGAGNTHDTTKYGPNGIKGDGDPWPADPNVDATFYSGLGSGCTYVKTMTIDDAVATPKNERGTVEVEVANEGVEDVIIITLTEYPEDYSGENPICVEWGEKEYKELPEEVQVKIPQVAWAGEKIVLEKHWGGAVVGNIVTFQLDGGSIGTLASIDGLSIGDFVVTYVHSDGVARCFLETEYEGQAEVKSVLYDINLVDLGDAGMDALIIDDDGILGTVIGNHDFPVLFLKLESVEAIGDYPTVEVETDVDFGIQVKGWFITNCTELAVDPDTGEVRAEKKVDVDGDGTFDQVLPRGRWVLPDDWPRLAGIYETRPHWDLMDNNTDAIDSTNPLGPFNTAVVTTDPPNVAEKNTVGPFNTTQPVAIDPDDELLKWVSAATVVGDDTLTSPADLRNTVVPNGILEWQDCPMPAAYLQFTVSGTTLNEAPKTEVAGYFSGTAPDFYYEWPFYSYEIPSSRFIPIGGVPEGYRWNSWGWTVAGPETGTAMGPYEFWTDLGVSTATTKLEVYTDNNGRAYVTMCGKSTPGTAEIYAIADYPYQRKHTAIQSADTEQTWGEPSPPEDTWCFTAAGFFPEHLPDTYTGEVVLADIPLVSIPEEIQGVWYYDDILADWIFWIPGVGGDLLVLKGGTVANYTVLVSGECCWTIELTPLP
jgi:hypothetical protein